MEKTLLECEKTLRIVRAQRDAAYDMIEVKETAHTELVREYSSCSNALIEMRNSNEVHRKGYYAYKEADESKGKSIAILKATIRELLK